jgi:orotate phosphoribosyltransferase
MNQLDQTLILNGLIKRGDFTLASGKKSDVYYDVKTVLTKPHVLREVAQSISTRMSSGIDRLAGMELGSIPIVAATSVNCGVDYLMIRKKAKDHGTSSLIEGSFEPGMDVVLLEDVVTTGKSVIDAVETLSSAGMNVKKIIAVLDRRNDDEIWRNYNGTEYVPLVTMYDIMEWEK